MEIILTYLLIVLFAFICFFLLFSTENVPCGGRNKKRTETVRL